MGYVVACFSRINENVGSFQVLVQSEEFTPGHVLNSTNAFLAHFYNEKVLSESFTSNFSDHKMVLRDSLSMKDLTLSDKTSRFWLEIKSNRHQFDLKRQKLDILESLNVTKFQEFYHSLILESETRRKLIVVVYGQDKEIGVEDLQVDCAVLYDELEHTKAKLKTYGTCT